MPSSSEKKLVLFLGPSESVLGQALAQSCALGARASLPDDEDGLVAIPGAALVRSRSHGDALAWLSGSSFAAVVVSPGFFLGARQVFPSESEIISLLALVPESTPLLFSSVLGSEHNKEVVRLAKERFKANFHAGNGLTINDMLVFVKEQLEPAATQRDAARAVPEPEAPLPGNENTAGSPASPAAPKATLSGRALGDWVASFPQARGPNRQLLADLFQAVEDAAAGSDPGWADRERAFLHRKLARLAPAHLQLVIPHLLEAARSSLPPENKRALLSRLVAFCLKLYSRSPPGPQKTLASEPEPHGPAPLHEPGAAPGLGSAEPRPRLPLNRPAEIAESKTKPAPLSDGEFQRPLPLKRRAPRRPKKPGLVPLLPAVRRPFNP